MPAALWQAIKQTWAYMLFGVGLGSLFAVVGMAFDEKSFLRESMVHLSNGFFVSAIAVLFYEWGAHAKHAMDLSTQLGNLLEVKGIEAIEHGMEATFRGEGDVLQGLKSEHRKLIEALRDLNSDENHGRDADIAFLTLFITHAARYGNQLRTLRQHLIEPGNEVERPFHLDFTKLAYADNILTNWMKLLGKGDSYVTLSNARTWSALKSGGFKKAGREAVVRGAHVRRIFVMTGHEQYSPDDLRNLVEHYQFAANRKGQGEGSYRIHIAGADVAKQWNLKPENQHYGIFTAHFAPRGRGRDANGPTSVAFKVIGTEVENFELVAVEPRGELIRSFEEIWESLELSRDGPIIGRDGNPTRTGPGRFLDAVMSREVRLLIGSDSTCRVDIVSTLESWPEKPPHELNDFYEAIGRLRVRHLFVIDREEQRAEVEKRTAARMRAAGEPPWEVKAVAAPRVVDRRHWLVPHWRIADAGGRSLHQCVFTLNCKPDLSDFFLTKEDSPVKAADYARNFAEVWETPETPLAGRTEGVS